MSIITESKATRRLTVLLVMIIGVAMIIPSSYISKYILKPIETDSLINLIDEIVKE